MTKTKSIMTIAGLFLFGISTGNSISSDTGSGSHRLEPCPRSPNCVSSLEPESRHFIEPLSYTGASEAAYRSLVDLLESLPRVRIVAKRSRYLHAEFKSGGFGFVDDVEFSFPQDKSLIHVRSASRKGYYDFGANRKRIERIRRLFTAALNR